MAARAPQLIVGHGVLGRLLARLTLAAGHAAPTVWETNPDTPGRRGRLQGRIIPTAIRGGIIASIFDVSGDCAILDTLIARLARGGEIVLAGFYDKPLSFAFRAVLHARNAHPRRCRMEARRPGRHAGG